MPGDSNQFDRDISVAMAATTRQDLTASLADLAATTAANEALRRANADLEASRAALRESEARLRLAQEAAGIGVWERNIATGEAVWSEEMFHLYGLASADRPPNREALLDLVHPEDRPRLAYEAALRGAAAPGPFQVDMRIRRANDRAVRWLHSTGRVIPGPDGRLERLIGVTLDITERKASEERLRAAERQTREVLESLGEALFALDGGTRVRFASRKVLDLWGRSADEVLGRTVLEVFPQAAGTATWQAVVDVLDTRHEVHLCAYSPLIGHWIEADIYPSEGGGVTVAFRNIQGQRDAHLERVRAEAALRASEERLRVATKGAGVGIWEFDLASGHGRWSIESSELFGVERVTFAVEDWIDAIHPDDRARAAEAWQRAMEEGAPYEVEYRSLVPNHDGSERWLLDRGQVVRDTAGRPVRGTGILLDVTPRVRAEAVTRDALAELRAVYETAPVGLCVLDAGMRWTRINARMAEINGLPPEAHLGRTIREVLPSLADAGEALHRRVMDTGEPVLGIEIEGETPAQPGVRRVWEESWFPLSDAAGRVVAINVVAEEVTERKEAEARQILLMRELDHRAKNALAVVQAALRLTPKDDPVAFAQAVEGRVNALARAHTLLARGRWTGAELRALLAGELAPFRPGAHTPKEEASPRIDLRGPAVTLAPAASQAFSMALHELATNATKYGALSVPEGRVSVVWDLDRDADSLRLLWTEMGGPRVKAPPRRQGFGSRVLKTIIQDQLGGQVERRWEASGLACAITLPLARVLVERVTMGVPTHP